MILNITKTFISETVQLMSFRKKVEHHGPLVLVDLVYSNFDHNRNDHFVLSCPPFVRNLDVNRTERVPEEWSLRGYVMRTIFDADVVCVTTRGSVSDVMPIIEKLTPKLSVVNRNIPLPNNSVMVNMEMKYADSGRQDNHF